MANDTTTPELSNEFAAIVNGSRDLDQAADEIVSGPKPADQVAAELVDPVAAWAEIPSMIGSVLGMALPEAKRIYTPDACKEWGRAMHRVAVKRGWDADGLPPEVGAALTSAMFVIPTLALIKSKRDAVRQAQLAKEAAAGGAAAGVLPENSGLPGGDAAP